MAILVDTASWIDKTLIDCGRFYPKEAKTPEARLRYYSSIVSVLSFHLDPGPRSVIFKRRSRIQ